MTILLCTIGAATITTWLFRLIDAIDRSCGAASQTLVCA